jgi:hypothetical protein
MVIKLMIRSEYARRVLNFFEIALLK